MKINFGYLKGKKLIVGKNKKMRPTQALAKSIIFNTLDLNKEDIVLDVFAGTGALGFEAASLGVKQVVWFDNNFDSVKAIKLNLINFKLASSNFQVYKVDFRTGIRSLKFKPTVIFLDPPFIAENYYEAALNLFLKHNIISIKTTIILEKKKTLEISSIKKFFYIKKMKKLGDKEILFLKLRVKEVKNE